MSLLRQFFILTAVITFAVFPQSSLLRSGPMVGYGQMTEVLLWVQTTSAASVQYRYWDASEPAKILKSTVTAATEENAFIVKTIISGLKPGTKFGYELLLNGKAVKRNYPLRFQTQPLWQWRTDPPSFTIAFGSCTFVNEPEIDRPGRPYGNDYNIFSTIASVQPDIFLWGGDNVYLREVDWDSRSGILYRYAHTRQIPEMQPLLGATHNYALWDDHDFGPNNSDRSYRLRDEALDVFSRFWGNQTYGTEETPGTFGRFTWNDVEIFMLDNRYHRSPNRAPNTEEKTMFGKAQLQWLKDALLNSQENGSITFRLIVSGNQILNANAEFAESLPRLFPHEYNELIAFIKANAIPGILFLTGDRHHTELIALSDSSFYTLYEFTSSALTSGLNPLKNRDGVPNKEYTNPMRVDSTLVNDKHNFGLLTFSGKQTDRSVKLECIDITGTRRWTRVISAHDVRLR